ncbi:hypothetical protein ACFSTH_08195 [Paenibacillus yanchengensis]|uniref:Replicative helicase inhibitor G39P N-terminal domain-containing protein n=1 Tax=Paenibacillus yanchengensis TaxID=2035833 RepID=A0ABW4YLG8_9BACL
MTKNEVILIIAELVENYPNFDSGDENIDRHYKYLSDFPFEAAMQNVQEHIKTNRFPPLIADIRGRLGDQMDGQRSKDATAAHFANLDAWGADGTPPPEGYWEHGRRLLRGEAD